MNMAQRCSTRATVWIYLVYSSCKNHKASEGKEEKNSSGGPSKRGGKRTSADVWRKSPDQFVAESANEMSEIAEEQNERSTKTRGEKC